MILLSSWKSLHPRRVGSTSYSVPIGPRSCILMGQLARGRRRDKCCAAVLRWRPLPSGSLSRLHVPLSSRTATKLHRASAIIQRLTEIKIQSTTMPFPTAPGTSRTHTNNLPHRPPRLPLHRSRKLPSHANDNPRLRPAVPNRHLPPRTTLELCSQETFCPFPSSPVASRDGAASPYPG